MKKIKLLTVGLLSTLFMMSISTNAEMVDINDYDLPEITQNEMVIFDKETASKLALDFASSLVPNVNFSISSLVPIEDVIGETIGYDVAFKSDLEEDYGYVIIDFRLKEDYISRYSIEKGVPDYYFSMTQQISEHAEEQVNTNDAKILETMPNELNVIVDDEVFRTDGETLSINEFEEYKEDISTESQEIIDNSDEYTASAKYEHSQDFIGPYPTGYIYKSSYYLRQYNYLTIDRVKKVTGKYGCSIAALGIIANSYNLYNSNNDKELKTALNRLWTLAGTDSGGSTKINKIGPTLVSYAKEKGLSLTQTTTDSPSFSSIQTAISNSKPVALSMVYYKKAGGTSGHTVFVQGVVTLTKGKSTHNFVACADGWNANVAYINYSTVPSTWDYYAASIWSGKKLFY